MIVFVLGTSAEAIKVRPVIQRLRNRGVDIEIWSTYQHTDALDTALDALGIPRPAFGFARGARGKAIEKPGQMIPWLASAIGSLLRNRKQLRQRLGERPLIVIHGDTVTTVFGAFAAKVLRAPSAHIEAGLRSGKLFRPFPEEIDRRITGRVANIHFAPNADAASNLRRKDVIDTGRNTAIDGVLDTLDAAVRPVGAELQSPYGLVLLHRFEFISQPQLVCETINALERDSPVPLVVLVDVFSGGPINEAVNALNSPKIRTIAKLDYPQFVKAMDGAEFIFTDSGGIQQEAGLLGVPTMLHRQVTESPDGMGRNIILSGWELSKVRQFLSDYPALRHPIDRPDKSPSDIIVDELLKRGYR